MTPRLLIFCLWSLLLALGTIIISYYAWSPYSSEERPVAGQSYGPTHK